MLTRMQQAEPKAGLVPLRRPLIVPANAAAKPVREAPVKEPVARRK